MILRACVKCGTLSERTRCPAHRKDNRASPAKRGYDRKWRKTRADYIHLYPWCCECGAIATDVDHIDGLGPKGPNGHDHFNLRSFCHSCHSKRTARDQGPTAPRRTWNDSIVVLVGPSGVGKTEVRKVLAPRLNYASLGPDDFMERWQTLLIRLDATPHAVIECVKIHKGLRQRMNQRGTTVVELTAPLPVLAKRMEKRGESSATVSKRLSESKDYSADLVVSVADRTPDEIADLIEQHVKNLAL